MDGLIKSTEYLQRGHKLPLFKYIVTKYEKESNNKKKTNDGGQNKRAELNEKDSYFQSIKLGQILPR